MDDIKNTFSTRLNNVENQIQDCQIQLKKLDPNGPQGDDGYDDDFVNEQ